MFETIYCAEESFANELEATDRLGWVAGDILRDLSHPDVDAVRTINWATQPLEMKDLLKRSREATLEAVSEIEIRKAIRSNDSAKLEIAKAGILRPILDKYGCFESGAPNSLNTWIAGAGQPQTDVQLQLDKLVYPIVAGLPVCRPPGSAVSQAARDRQAHVQQTIETPMIFDLVAGDGEYSGDRGFEPYVRRLEPFKDAYEPTNDQLRNDWRDNRENLLRLRDAARKHLWPDLHGYWLPRLAKDTDTKAKRDFERWIKGALLLAPIARYLTNPPTRIVVGSLSVLGVNAALHAAGVPLYELVGGDAAAIAGRSILSRRGNRIGELALFYQAALKKPRPRHARG
jgi:hypothetical protein